MVHSIIELFEPSSPLQRGGFTCTHNLALGPSNMGAHVCACWHLLCESKPKRSTAKKCSLFVCPTKSYYSSPLLYTFAFPPDLLKKLDFFVLLYSFPSLRLRLGRPPKIAQLIRSSVKFCFCVCSCPFPLLCSLQTFEGKWEKQEKCLNLSVPFATAVHAKEERKEITRCLLESPSPVYQAQRDGSQECSTLLQCQCQLELEPINQHLQCFQNKEEEEERLNEPCRPFNPLHLSRHTRGRYKLKWTLD